MRVQKILLYLLSLMCFCLAEENGAFVGFGVQFSLMKAVEKNDPFLNQERIIQIENAQNKIAQLNKVENQVKGMSKNFEYINTNLKDTKNPIDMAFGLHYLKTTVQDIQKIIVISNSASSNPNLVQALEKMQEPITNPLTKPSEFETNLKNLELQFAQSQNSILSHLSSQVTGISHSLNTLDPLTYSKNISSMYGVSLSVGYKHFFGKKRNQGFRYYLFYDYGYSNPKFVGNGTTSLGKMNNNVYGLGVDYLLNFIDNLQTHFSAGFYVGFALAGSSWVGKGASAWISQMDFINNYLPNYSAKMHTSYFQIPLNFGFRINVDKHNGFEMGVKIPLAINSYFESHGNGLNSELFFKRLMVFNFGYVYNF
ncbi:outer membrane protein [Helicobacter cetorum]|uniref:Outer membrane protein (Omp22) n=1 Tax=Helicobacter cetorum (strain ATCC BAA-540 / CCUG 52418 / MIT 99-5656) TaxID=1163745 RepID=I0ETC5_HELCM|nr:outer membrane protein [Helicobacter cetorum]AFI06194.1 outer membrane protein (omp22) [Helicobacter cetorum MIT 99-5656]